MELMVLLDKGLQEAIHIEEKLDWYSDKLQVWEEGRREAVRECGGGKM